jgi:large subunit ribosomal protein L21
MYAVIVTGGKQYRVKEGDLLSVEKLDIPGGQKVDFDRVLLLEDGQDIQVGTPILEKAVVRAAVIETYKDEKVLVFKKKRRKQFRRTRGHRQLLTRVKIERIVADRAALPAEEAPAQAPAPVKAKPAAAVAAPEVEPRPAAETKKPAPKRAAARKTAPAGKAPAKPKPAAKKDERKKTAASKAGKKSKE